MNHDHMVEGEPSDYSPAEQLLYFEQQRNGRIPGWIFNKRIVIDGVSMYVDLCHPGICAVIEIDGQQHEGFDQVIRDSDRDDLLRKDGWTVMRFSHYRVMDRPDSVLKWAESAVMELPIARERARTLRAENQLSQARRRVHEAVLELAPLQHASGAWPNIATEGDVAKTINQHLARKFGRAADRTLEQHLAALETVQDRIDALKRTY